MQDELVAGCKKYDNFDYEPYRDKIIKVIVDKKTDYYMFDQFVDNFYKKINVTDIKVIEDFSDLKAENVKNEIIYNRFFFPASSNVALCSRCGAFIWTGKVCHGIAFS